MKKTKGAAAPVVVRFAPLLFAMMRRNSDIFLCGLLLVYLQAAVPVCVLRVASVVCENSQRVEIFFQEAGILDRSGVVQMISMITGIMRPVDPDLVVVEIGIQIINVELLASAAMALCWAYSHDSACGADRNTSLAPCASQ